MATLQFTTWVTGVAVVSFGSDEPMETLRSDSSPEPTVSV